MRYRVLPVFLILPKLVQVDFESSRLFVYLGGGPRAMAQDRLFESPRKKSFAILAAVSVFSSATFSRTLAFSEN